MKSISSKKSVEKRSKGDSGKVKIVFILISLCTLIIDRLHLTLFYLHKASSITKVTEYNNFTLV